MQFEVKGDGRLALKLKQEENSGGNKYVLYFNYNNNQKFKIEKEGANKDSKFRMTPFMHM